jgi:Xaa-Pro aminopeptidase
MREKVTPEVEAFLTKLSIAIKDYDTFLGDIAKLSGNVYLDTAIANSALYETLPNKDAIQNTKPNIINKLKAIKNPVEIQGFINCHVRDGAAIVNYYEQCHV